MKRQIKPLRFTLLILLLFFIATPILASEKTVLLFPFQIYGDPSKAYLAKGLGSMFHSRLAGKGLKIIDYKEFYDLLDERESEGAISKERVEEIVRRHKGDFGISGSVTAIGEGYSLDMSILDLTKKGPDWTNISETVDENQLIFRLADMAYQFRSIIEGIPYSAYRRGAGPDTAYRETGKGLFFQSETPASSLEPTGTFSIDSTLISFDSHDLDKDGKAEFVVISHDKLMIYTMERDTFVLRDSLKAGMSERFLKVSIGDIDSDGRAEICLVTLYGSMSRTVVWQWSGGFKRLFHEQGNFRIVRDGSSRESIILFQGTRIGEPIYGEISEMEYGGKGRFSVVRTLPLLNDAQFYSLNLFDLKGDGTMEFIGLNRDSMLTVWDRDGNPIWEDHEKVGGSNNTVGFGEDLEHPSLPGYVFQLNSAPAAMDIDGDGKDEILAADNVSLMGGYLENLRIYTKGRLVAYRQEGHVLSRAWTTREFQYCISDVMSVGKALFLAAHKGKLSELMKESGRIMWFD